MPSSHHHHSHLMQNDLESNKNTSQVRNDRNDRNDRNGISVYGSVEKHIEDTCISSKQATTHFGANHNLKMQHPPDMAAPPSNGTGLVGNLSMSAASNSGSTSAPNYSTPPQWKPFQRMLTWYRNEPRHLRYAYIGLVLWGIFSYLNWQYRWISKCPYNKYIGHIFKSSHDTEATPLPNDEASQLTHSTSRNMASNSNASSENVSHKSSSESV